MNGNTRRRPAGRRAPIALAPIALALAFALAVPAVAQSPGPVYPIPPVPPPPAPPPPLPPPGGSARPALMRPFPTVRTAGSYNRLRTTFTRIAVSGPAGAVVSTGCTRARCSLRRTMGRSGRLRLRRLERDFAAGSVIVIRVTASGAIGKHVQIRIRRGRAPLRRDRCLPPGAADPAPCGSA